METSYENDNIVIVSYCNNNYVPYLSVLIQSIKANATQNHIYDIIIVEFHISEENKTKITDMCQCGNVKVRFLKINDDAIIQRSQKWEVRKWSKELYISILFPYILDEYDKVIYMDCDVINLCDLANLYGIDMGTNLVAASRLMARCCMETGDFLTEKVLKYEYDEFIVPFSDYFNNGIMLINLKSFRETYSLEYILSVIENQNFELLDQDCINFLCKGRVKYIEAGWNWYPYSDKEFKNTLKLCPHRYKTYFEDGFFYPKNIHYTIPVKPWLEPMGAYAESSSLFWKNALDTPFYDVITKRMLEYQIKKNIIVMYEKRCKRDFLSDVEQHSLVLYGLGNNGKHFLEDNNYNVEAIIDEDKVKQGKYKHIPVMGLSDFQKQYSNKDNCVILISNEQYEEILYSLYMIGYKNLYILHCMGDCYYGIKAADYEEILQAANLWSDDKSKNTFCQIIHKRISYMWDKNIKCLDIQEGNMYIFSQLLNIPIGCCIAFIDNYGMTANLMRKLIDKGSQRKIDILFQEKELCGQNVDMFFFRFCKGNIIEKIKANEQKIKKISGVLFIDIECKGCDLWRLPIFLKKEFSDYNIFLSHHWSFLNSGTVISAIPKKFNVNYNNI